MPSQEPVPLVEQLEWREWGDPEACRRAQRGRGAGGAQARMRVAVDELEVLRGELDVHDAARAGLEVARRRPSSRSIF